MTVFDIYGLVSNDSKYTTYLASPETETSERELRFFFIMKPYLAVVHRSNSYHLDSALDTIEMQYKRG